jgi:hypothetical protein
MAPKLTNHGSQFESRRCKDETQDPVVDGRFVVHKLHVHMSVQSMDSHFKVLACAKPVERLYRSNLL